MKKLKIIFWLCLSLFMGSCLQDGDNTIVLNEKNPLDAVIPNETRFAMEEHMPIYNGNTPPIIEGVFVSSPMQVVYSSSGGYEPGRITVDFFLKFSNQDRIANTVFYEAKEKNISTEGSSDVTILGSDDNFTAYFTTSGQSYGITTKRATIISGTISGKGIENFYYAFVMLEKGNDPENKLIEVGTYRIFKDGDGIAEETTWDKSLDLSSDGSDKETSGVARSQN